LCKNIDAVEILELFEFSKVPETIKYKKEIFGLPEIKYQK
jgi:hypothetical protein